MNNNFRLALTYTTPKLCLKSAMQTSSCPIPRQLTSQALVKDQQRGQDREASQGGRVPDTHVHS